MRKYYVYILKCSDNSYYTGVTNNLEKRLKEHNHNKNFCAYTTNRKPLKLVFSEMFQNIDDAIANEKRIKGWTRAKKEALIEGDFEKLIDLSKS